MKLSEFCKAPENTFDYFLQKQCYKYQYVFPALSNISPKISESCGWRRAIPVVRKELHQSCRMLKQLQVQRWLQNCLLYYKKRTDVLSQVKTALTKRVIIFLNEQTNHSLNSGKINFSSAGTNTSGQNNYQFPNVII